jgi:[FeFe] hydrogenase H-cluster maturation GTPase HydF
MEQIDLALIVFTYNYFSKEDRDLLNQLKSLNVPTILIHSKSDITPLTLGAETEITKLYGVDVVEYSCCLNDDTAQEEMRKTLVLSISKALNSSDILEKTILEGLVNEGDNIVLVCPIDSEAPQGRLILPETLAIRDALDKKGIAIVLQPSQLKKYIECNNNIKIVITDSQAFVEVASIVPKSIQLTSFSMLLARERGLFIEYTKGTKELSKLKEGSKVLILESCTHHATCEDIGRVKLPNLIRKHTGKNIEFEIVNGLDPISENMKEYSIVIQCGGCMVTKKQLQNRLRKAIDNGIPVTNYGMAIAYMTGIYDRAIKPLL